jgi:hypothetical protein
MSEKRDFTIDIGVTTPDAFVETQKSTKGQSFGEIVEKISSFISDWTPFCLVVSYYIASTSIYMYCSDGLIAIFWFIFMCTNFYIAGMTVLEGMLSTHRSTQLELTLNSFHEHHTLPRGPENCYASRKERLDLPHTT